MTTDEMLREALSELSESDEKSREVVLRAFRVGIFVAVEECQKLAEMSPTLRMDLLRLATRLRHRAKQVKL